MKTLLAIGLLFVAEGLALAQAPSAKTPAIQSVSGQFSIYDRRIPSALRPPGKAGDPALLELEPTVLVVSCERIKQALYAQLDAGREWSSSILVSVRLLRGKRDTAQIAVEKFGAKWIYRVELPERLARDQFIRTMVQVLLLELANRTTTERSAEIPLWLSEGLAQQLLASREVELILPKPTMAVGSMMITPNMVETRNPDPLANARQVLQNQPALALAELSWPDPDNFSREQAQVFQSSAQLFVCELLRLKNGRETMRNFIAALPQFYNWQPAFLRTYREHFSNQLALEKWWALQSEYFVGRDQQQLWTLAESAQKLEALLHATVAVRAKSGELPARKDVSLQVVIREWDTPRQLTTLQTKLTELAQARTRVAPAFMTLVNDYAVALDDYLKKRKRSTATFSNFWSLPPSIQKVAAEACQRLDALDLRRAAISTENSTNSVAGIGANPTLK